MNAGFKNCHPTVNILFFVGVVVFSMILQHPVSLAVSFFASLCYYIRLKGKTAAHGFFCFLLPMLLIVIVINGLFSHYGITELFELSSGNQVTLESLVYGFVTGLMVITVIMWFFCYNEIVTTDKFMHIFGKHMPSAALVVSMALRFIPMYRERLHIIAESQQGIGEDYKSGNLSDRFRNGSKIISMLITWALENAIVTSDSMRSRGYGSGHRSSYSRFRWKRADTMLTIIMSVAIILITAVTVAGGLKCFYNPQIIINPASSDGIAFTNNRLNVVFNPLSVYGIFALAAYTLFCFLPLIIDLKDEIKWNSIKSNI